MAKARSRESLPEEVQRLLVKTNVQPVRLFELVTDLLRQITSYGSDFFSKGGVSVWTNVLLDVFRPEIGPDGRQHVFEKPE